MKYLHYWDLRSIEAWKENRERIIGDFLRLIPHLPLKENEPELSEGATFVGRVHQNSSFSESSAVIEILHPSGTECFYIVFPYEDEEKARREIAEIGWASDSSGPCGTHPGTPYDLAVTGLLLLAKHYLDDDILLFSDGCAYSPDGCKEAMLPAAQLIERVLGYRIDPEEAMKRHLSLWLVEVEETGERFIYRYYGARSPKPVEVQAGLMEKDEWDEYDESEWPFRGPYRVLQRIEVPEEELAKVGLDRYPIYPPRD